MKEAPLKQGFVLPPASPTELLDHAVAADAAGWDGVFVSELAYGVDPWTLLAAVATRTEHLRLGTMLTPLPWRRPWKLASQVATLDHVSNGRAVLAVALGAVDDALGNFGEPTDRATRAALLDEGIDVIQSLWSGERRFEGSRYDVDLTKAEVLGELLRPVGGAPIWCVGALGAERSLQRILRVDGLLPTTIASDGARQSTPDELAEILRWLADHGKQPGTFDVIVEGETEPGDDTPLQPWRDVGATWWTETRWTAEDQATVRRRIDAGPVR